MSMGESSGLFFLSKIEGLDQVVFQVQKFLRDGNAGVVGELLQHIVGVVGLIDMETTGAETVCHMQTLEAVVLDDTGELLYKEILKISTVRGALYKTYIAWIYPAVLIEVV